MDNPTFRRVMDMIYLGDDRAAEVLVEEFSADLMRQIHGWLRTKRLRRRIDPEDVLQEVMFAFFSAAQRKRFDLQSAEDLLGLLMVMCRRQFLKLLCKEQSLKRDVRRILPIPVDELALLSGNREASEITARREAETLAKSVLAAIDPLERELIEQRASGVSWADLGSRFGVSDEAARKRHARLLRRLPPPPAVVCGS